MAELSGGAEPWLMYYPLNPVQKVNGAVLVRRSFSEAVSPVRLQRLVRSRYDDVVIVDDARYQDLFGRALPR